MKWAMEASSAKIPREVDSFSLDINDVFEKGETSQILGKDWVKKRQSPSLGSEEEFITQIP